MISGDLIYLSIIGLLVIVIIFLIVRSRFQAEQVKMPISPEYVQGLEALLDGDVAKAMEKFKLAAVRNTADVDAYIRIGEILRKSNKLKGALKIHKQLTVRKELKEEQKQKVYRSIIVDYLTARQFEDALVNVQELLKIDKNDVWALQKEIECYERMGQWEDAFKQKQRLIKSTGNSDNEMLALYKVQQGYVFCNEEKNKECKAAFNEALKLDDTCVPAYLALADLSYVEKKPEDALKYLKSLIKKSPESAHLGFDKLKDILFELGKYSEIETIVRDAQKKLPEDTHLALALAEIYEKKGNVEASAELLHQIISKEPENSLAMFHQLRTLSKRGQHHDALEVAANWLEKRLNQAKRYQCHACHYRASEPFWYCPQCFSWKTMKTLV